MKKILIVPLLFLSLTACGNNNSNTSTNEDLNQNIDFDISNLEINTSADIILSEKNISSSNSSVSIDGNIVTIDNGGEYIISGILEDGQIIIDAPDEDVNIVLDNVVMTNSSGPAIYAIDAQDVLLTLAEGSRNIFSDGSDYDMDDSDDAPNATIFSMADLKVEGNEGASLEIIANHKDGIVSKDDLDINNLDLAINAEDDGLRGKDSVEINNSEIVINAEGDGIKSDNDDEDKGYLAITGSNIVINAGDDGIHAENLVEIFSGNIDIQDSFEGVEGKRVTIHDGNINIVSSDDGINVSASTEDYKGEDVILGAMVNVFGGTVTLNTGGDGFDPNGSAVMTGGTLIINGPSEDRNGAIDVNGSFDISGGTLIAVGSSGMAETPDETSSQYVIQVNFEAPLSARTEISLIEQSGKEIFSFAPEKTFQSITYSGEALAQGESYSLLVNGEVYTSLSIEKTITKYGENTSKMRKR